MGLLIEPSFSAAQAPSSASGPSLTLRCSAQLWNLRVGLRGEIQVPSEALIGIGFYASLPIKRHCPRCCALAGSSGTLGACAQETKCDQALARLRFLTRLSPSRSDRKRTRARGRRELRPLIGRALTGPSGARGAEPLHYHKIESGGPRY